MSTAAMNASTQSFSSKISTNAPSHAAAMNEISQAIPHLEYTHTVQRLHFPKDAKNQVPRYLAVDEPTPLDGETFLNVKDLKTNLKRKSTLRTVKQMPGFLNEYTIVGGRQPSLLRVPKNLPKGEKVQWLSTQCGHRVVKLAAGQIPFHYSDEQVATGVTIVTGAPVVTVESMMHSTGKGRNGFRFIFVFEQDAARVVALMNRLCLFTTTSVCTFSSEYALSPLIWCQMLVHNNATEVAEGAPKSLLPMTLCVAAAQ